MFKSQVWRYRLIVAVHAAVLLAVASCATDTKTGQPKSETAALDPEAKKKIEEMRNETEIGRNMAGRLLQFYGAFEDEQVVGYLNQVGNFVAGYGDYPERRYMFAVINVDQVNAFACPGGYVLITLGALRNAQNEAELSAVLAHEVAHVGKRHMFNALQKMSPDDLNKAAREAEKNLPSSVTVRRRLAPIQEDKAGETLARYLSGSAAGLSILQAAKAGMSVILEKGLGAELEYEADREGVKYAIRSGYHPAALTDFLCRIDHGFPGKSNRCATKAEAAGNKPKTILEKTHPPVDERVKNIKVLLAEMKASEIVGALGKPRFDKVMEGLPKVATRK